MRDLAERIPDVEQLLTLEPEELGAKLLFVLRQRIEEDDKLVHLGNFLLELAGTGNRVSDFWPIEKFEEITVAICEAWAWLEAQGMLIPSPDPNGPDGFHILSRRALQYEDETKFANTRVVRILPKEVLHPRIADKVWAAFVRGDFAVAVFQAMKGVEVFVREASRFPDSGIGVKLMQEAFKPDGGVLTDKDTGNSEKVARMQLFAGAIGAHKNPNSHRDVDMNDPREALEVMMLANHLMRIVEARRPSEDSSAAG